MINGYQIMIENKNYCLGRNVDCYVGNNKDLLYYQKYVILFETKENQKRQYKTFKRIEYKKKHFATSFSFSEYVICTDW